MKHKLILAVGLFTFVAGFTAGYGVHSAVPKSGLQGKFDQVVRLIDDLYYREIPRAQLDTAVFTALAGTLDPNSEYFDAQGWARFDEDMKSELHGVGIRIEADLASGYIKVVAPIEGSPAAAAGVMPGDLIVAVDGTSIKGKPTDAVIRTIKGAEGTEVTLTLKRGEADPFDVKLKRAVIKLPAVKAHRFGDVGYLRIVGFSEEVTKEFERNVATLNAKAWIIDLRFNTGGLLSEAVDLASLVVGKKTIVETRGRRSKETRAGERDAHPALAGKKIVVLVNEGSASASEILAGALQDHKAATIVGVRSYGKGSVQIPMALEDGTRFKLTTALYYLPAGRSPHRDNAEDKDYGITPDHEIRMTDEQINALFKWWASESGEPSGDPMIEKALELLK